LTISGNDPRKVQSVSKRACSVSPISFSASRMAAGKPANLVYGASWPPPYPYLLFYEVKDDEVVIVGVRHGARGPGSMPGEGAAP
jgi:hypothetical protein